MIVSVEEVKVNKEITELHWMDSGEGFGILTIEYNGHGGFTFDAEYLSLDTVCNIIKKWKE